MNVNAVAVVIAFCLLLAGCACGALLIVGLNDPCLGFEPPICGPEPILIVWQEPVALLTATPTTARYPTITPDGSLYHWMIPTPGPGQAPMPQAWARPQYCNAHNCAPATGTPGCTLIAEQWFCK